MELFFSLWEMSLCGKPTSLVKNRHSEHALLYREALIYLSTAELETFSMQQLLIVGFTLKGLG